MTTTIQISEELLDKLKMRKLYNKESYEEVILDALEDSQELSEQTKKEITPFLETIKRREVIPIDYHIFTRNEFLEMLQADSENVGKQIFKSNIVYYGYIPYCNLVKAKK